MAIDNQGCDDPFQPNDALCESYEGEAESREIVIDESQIQLPDNTVPVRSPATGETQLRETVIVPIINFETPLPTKAEVGLATSTAAVTATTAVVVTSIVQQLIRILTPAFKLALMKLFHVKSVPNNSEDGDGKEG